MWLDRHVVTHSLLKGDSQMDTNQEKSSSTRRVTFPNVYFRPQTHEATLSICATLIKEIQAISQYDNLRLAKVSRIPLSTLYRIAGGTTRKPSIKTFNKLLGIYCLLCHPIDKSGGNTC